jgi:hypothetical protein
MMTLGIEPAICRLCSTLNQLLIGYVVDIIAYKHLMHLKRGAKGKVLIKQREFRCLHAIKGFVELCCRFLARVQLFYHYCFHPMILSVR